MAVLRVLALAAMVLLLFIPGGLSDFVSDEEDLRQAILTNYSTKVRPKYKTQILVSLMLSSLNSLDIASQSMSVNIILTSNWNDQRLVWNSSLFGGLNTLVTAPEDVWTPPLVIENSVDNVGVLGGKDRDATPVRISNTGDVQWSPPNEMTVSCEMLIAQYPFDTQACAIIVYGWTYPLSEMEVIIPASVDLQLFSPNGEFELVTTRTYSNNVGGPGDENTYKKVYFEVTFRRKWQFYGQNLLMPIVLNSILMNAVFLLPIESGDKMSYCLTVLLSYVVFLTWVTENLPPISTDTSVLQVYLAVVLCLGCLATLLTTWVLNLYHRPNNIPLNSFYLTLATRLSMAGACTKTKISSAPDARATNGNGRTPGRPSSVSGVLDILDADIASAREKETLEQCSDARAKWGHDVKKETRPAVTWQELAALLDTLFFWVFAATLLVLTTVIFSLLYAKY